jgi:hypothetical protein
MFQLPPVRGYLRLLATSALFVSSSYCLAAPPALPSLSPRPVRIAPREAWRQAEAFVAKNPACEIVMGSGGSMLPLYADHTVLVLQRMPVDELRAGMTVVFIGDRGRPVAHMLVERTSRGWRAQGLANRNQDETVVRARNYIGTVVKAFTPVIGLAGSETLAEAARTASNSGGD